MPDRGMPESGPRPVVADKSRQGPASLFKSIRRCFTRPVQGISPDAAPPGGCEGKASLDKTGLNKTERALKRIS